MVEGEQFGGGSGESTSALASGQGCRRCEGYPYSSRARLSIRAAGEPAARASGASPGDDVPYHMSTERTIAARIRWRDALSLSSAPLAGRAAQIPCSAFSPSAASAHERLQRAQGEGCGPRSPEPGATSAGRSRRRATRSAIAPQSRAAPRPLQGGRRAHSARGCRDGLGHPRYEGEAQRGEGEDDPGRLQRAGVGVGPGPEGRVPATRRHPQARPGIRRDPAHDQRQRDARQEQTCHSELATVKMTTTLTIAVVR